MKINCIYFFISCNDNKVEITSAINQFKCSFCVLILEVLAWYQAIKYKLCVVKKIYGKDKFKSLTGNVTV